MKKFYLFPLLAVFSVMLTSLVCCGEKFRLESPSLGKYFTKKYVYNRYGCGGRNVSPALEWKNPPANTRSFALTMFDPDAPTGHGWWHWIVVNIPVSHTHLAEGAGSTDPRKLPAGAVQTFNDYKEKGYGGPCPPKGSGVHRYVFTLYALDVPQLSVSPGAKPGEAVAEIRKHSLATARFVSRYGRN